MEIDYKILDLIDLDLEACEEAMRDPSTEFKDFPIALTEDANA